MALASVAGHLAKGRNRESISSRFERPRAGNAPVELSGWSPTHATFTNLRDSGASYSILGKCRGGWKNDNREKRWFYSTPVLPVPALEVVLAKQTLVLAWNQFVYAEGSDGEVRIAFASHDVIVRGAGLSPLLRAIPGHHVASIRDECAT